MKRIVLSQGKFALVDDADFEWLNQWKWHASKVSQTYYAAHTIHKSNRKWTSIQMHHLILEAGIGMQIDHKNNDGLDNQRNNLRICTRSQNQMNARKRKNGTSQYKGVYWYARYNKWHSAITANQRRHCLGYFQNETDAAIAYDKKAKELFGKFAKLNFF